ncbi:MAG: Holliday junction resolvase RuvX [Saccharofermentanales bacterium]
MKRKMAIDYGTARIGIAISDPLGITARGIETIRWNGRDIEWAVNRILELCKENQVDAVIIGLPRRTDAKENLAEQNIRALAKRIEESAGVKVILKDERYTTVIANGIMRETGVKQAKRREIVDQIAAEIILQDYLNHCHD